MGKSANTKMTGKVTEEVGFTVTGRVIPEILFIAVMT
jgi:hypothetical protein